LARIASGVTVSIVGSGVVAVSSLSTGFAGSRNRAGGLARSAIHAPVTPAPASGAQSGSGAGSAAGGGSGFFFFAVAALLSLAALFVPRVIGTLKLFGRSLAPEPFLLSLERPG
jgi:hypothetical protein